MRKQVNRFMTTPYQITMSYRGWEIAVDGEYQKGTPGDRTTAPTADSFYIKTIILDGQEIDTLPDEDDYIDLHDLEQVILERCF